MNAHLLNCLAGAAAIAWPGLASAQAPAPPPAAPPLTATSPAPATPSPGHAGEPTPEDLAASIEAVGHADARRLVTDSAYAAEILRHLDRIAPLFAQDPEASLAVENMRLLAMIPLNRRDDAGAMIDASLARQPRAPSDYGGPWLAALSFNDKARALAVIETASRNVPGVGWRELRALFERNEVHILLNQFHEAHDEASRARTADALFRIGWPGDDSQASDNLRSILIDDRLAHDDNVAAAGFAAGLSTPASVLPLIVRKRYDALISPGQDRIALLTNTLDQRDRETAAALAAAPQNLRRVLDRAQYLRGISRDADALALLAPYIRDVRGTVAADEVGMWVVNEAAYAQLGLGRPADAVALMRRLAALPIAPNIGLIGPDINFAIVLTQAGRDAEALDHAFRLERESGQYASDFGKMWIASAITCSLARLGRGAEATAQMERLRAHADLNPAALTRAYLCLGDLDAAAATLVRRLGADDPTSALLALQNYTLDRGVLPEERLARTLLTLRERPEVRAALDRVGRVLTLPLSRTYWGDF